MLAVAALVGSCNRNQPPEITAAKAFPEQVEAGAAVELIVTATDPEGGKLKYSWKCKDGRLSGSQDSTAVWTAPDKPNDYKVTVTVRDTKGASVTKTIDVKVAKAVSRYSGSLSAPSSTSPQKRGTRTPVQKPPRKTRRVSKTK